MIADDREFDQYRLVEVISEGPEESLILVENLSGEFLFAKRASKLFREDKNQIDILTLEYETLYRLKYEGFLQPVELVRCNSEIIQVFNAAHTISLDWFLATDISENGLMPEKARLSLIWKVLNRAIGIRKINANNSDSGILLSADYRPSAIMLTNQGICKMGLVTASRPCDLSNSISQVSFRDFVRYAAPEQVISGKTPDIRSSYYGIGVLVYLIATGKHLFSIGHPQFEGHIKRRKAQNLYPLISDVKPTLTWMDGAVSGLLDSDPDKRESAMQELAHLIEARESDEGQGTLTERILRQIERQKPKPKIV